MDRNSIVRWIFIASIMALGYCFFYGKKSGDAVAQVPGETYVDAPGFAPDVLDVEPGTARAAPTARRERSARFTATASRRSSRRAGRASRTSA